MVISIDAGKKIDKIQHIFVIKTLDKLDREGIYWTHKDHYIKSPQQTLYSMVRNWKLFP